MNAEKIVERITDICEPYSDGEPDLYDLPIYVNGRLVNGVKIVTSDNIAGDRIELTTEDQHQTLTRSIRVERYEEENAINASGLACLLCGVLVVAAVMILGSL